MMKNKDKQILKDLYKDLLEVAKVNNPSYYMMPKIFYNSIIERMQYFERALKNARDSNDRLRKKLKEIENDR